MSSPLFIRCDASTDIGTGHVMRCLALAQAWIDKGGHVCFICAHLPEKLEERLRSESCEVVRIQAVSGGSEDLDLTLSTADENAAGSWFVIDGYAFDRDYQRGIRAAGYRALLIDDYNHLSRYECDILLNQNIGAEEYAYKINAGARLLLGPKYTLLRKEFRQALGEQAAGMERNNTGGEASVLRPHPEECMKGPAPPSPASRRSAGRHAGGSVRNILVTMGGADTHNVSLKVVRALNAARIKNLHAKILIGAANPHRKSLKQSVAESTFDCELVMGAEDMPTLMQWADLAISAAGSTCWELLAMGVPIIMVVLAENQTRIAEQLAADGLAETIGWHNEWSEEKFLGVLNDLYADQSRILSMRAAGMKTIDGRGVLRVMSVLLEAARIVFRPVTTADVELLLEWANDPETRSVSFMSDVIKEDTHRGWLAQRLANPECLLFIAEDSKGTALGHVRIEPVEDEFIISVNVAPEARGSGYASTMIAKVTERAHRVQPHARVIALIKPCNSRSVRAFIGAGYRHSGTQTVAGIEALRMIWEPEQTQ